MATRPTGKKPMPPKPKPPKPKPPMIAPDKVGSLRAIAKRDGGIKSNGEISRIWARKKLADPNTKASTRKKINFFLNFNE